MKRILLMLVGLSIILVSPELMAKNNLNLRFNESINGLLVNAEDLHRIISQSSNVARLVEGDYEITLYLNQTPVFRVGDLLIGKQNGSATKVEREIQWNENFKIIDDRYILVSSQPEFEWRQYPLTNFQPFKLLFYDKSSKHIKQVLEIEGNLKRDIAINNN